MIEKNHYIELWINGKLAELESQDGLNLRVNNVVYNPTKVAQQSGEYSFSFSLPSTNVNDKIFDFANNLSKLNKFRARYNAQVIADGVLIFDGSLVCRKYNHAEKQYECNLVNIKYSTIDDLFGEATLADMSWEVPYNVGETINSVNANPSSKYYFPLISYGAFQKEGAIPEGGDDDTPMEDRIYTSKYQFDETNIYTKDTFYPSLNVLEMLRKCFETKGYTVGGDAYEDPVLSNIYSSVNLADEQVVNYNAGNPKIGECHVSVSHVDTNDPTNGYFHQDLKYPYQYVGGEDITEGKFNFTEILYTNLLGGNSGNTRSYNPRENMFKNKDGYVQIPADGFYRIHLSGTVELLDSGNFVEERWVREAEDTGVASWGHLSAPFQAEVTHARNIFTTTPIELQLVKNYDDNIELIKGPYNTTFVCGFDVNGYAENPYSYIEDNAMFTNRLQRWSTFPHEPLGRIYRPYVGYGHNNGFFITDQSKIADWSYNRGPYYGVIPVRGNDIRQSSGVKMAYDPVVSDAFICGISTMGFPDRNSYGDNLGLGGTLAYRKNGYSWSNVYTDKNDGLYNIGDNQYVHNTPTTYKLFQGVYSPFQSPCYQVPYGIYTANVNNNTLPLLEGHVLNDYIEVSPKTEYDNAKAEFNLGCLMYLKKDDILNLMLVKKCLWHDGEMTSYKVSAEINFDIMAASPKDIETLKREGFAYSSPTEFPVNLNLFNFTSNETKVSDWLKNIANAFNLTYNFVGNSVEVMTNKPIVIKDFTAVNIDDRANSEDAISEYISYPKEMSVRYQIDDEEHGFYASVPSDKINRNDWKNFGDSGFSIVKLDDDTYNTDVQNVQLQFSYNWNDDFTWVDSASTPSVSSQLSVPVISKEEYMIDGYQDWEAMKHRGYGLRQRFFFRKFTPETYNSSGQMYNIKMSLSDDGHVLQGGTVVPGYDVNVYTPTNTYNGVTLNYKNDSQTLLTEYFNISPMLSSNYVTIECYLTPQEYLLLKNGSLVRFDDDLYIVGNIDGFDPSGNNLTKLKLIKKI